MSALNKIYIECISNKPPYSYFKRLLEEDEEKSRQKWGIWKIKNKRQLRSLFDNKHPNRDFQKAWDRGVDHLDKIYSGTKIW